jgi:AcrR family transcriptional regulator
MQREVRVGERVYGGLSADQRVSRRREQLLAAGLELYAERGWAGTTVQDLCRAATLSPRYFYEHFASREELFLELTAGIARDVHATVRAALAAAGPDPRGRAHAVLAALAEFFTADRRIVRVALVESLATERLRAHRRELLREFALMAADLMPALRTSPVSGTHARRRLELTATVLTGGMVEALMAWETSGTAPSALLVDHLTDLWVAAARL